MYVEVMASTYSILISLLLAATLAQGQVGSCPLNSCSLVNQVNICINGTSGGCSESCTTALMSSSMVEECCNRVVESLSPRPTSGGTCGEPGARTEFGELLDTVNNAQVAREIHAGIYIVSQTRNFVYSCSGCIKSIQLAVSTTSVLRNAQGQERIKFHTFANRTGDKVVFQRTESLTSWISSVNMTKPDRLVVDYRPNGSAEVCFSQGDVFGFTIEEESGINLMTRPTSDIDDFVLNATNAFPMSISGCPQLYTTGPRTAVTPLIRMVTGPRAATEAPSTTTEPPTTTESTTQATTGATTGSPTTSQPTNPAIGSTGGVSPPGGGYLIYAAAGFGGIIVILLIVVIIVVVICIVQRRKHQSYQYGNDFKHGSPIPGTDSKLKGVAVTAFSTRMSQIVDPNSNNDIITIENTLAEPAESPMHHYDLPSQLISSTNIHHLPWTDVPRESYVSMQTVTSSVSGSVSQISKTYDSAPELGTTPLLRRHGGTVKNPLYQETGPQEHTYHNPEELNVHQMKKLGTLGTSFEDDGIYTETETVGSPATPPTPLSMDNDSHYSPPPDEFDDNTNTFNPYHELLPGEVDDETGHHYFFLEKDKELENSLQVGSLGRHRVYEPGVYVPDAEERKKMTLRRGENPGSIYEIFEEKHRKLSGKKKKFFKEEDHFWKPDEEEDKIYNQLSEKQYREILRGQIKFEDHLGVGQFGSVSRATWNNEEGIKKVAVKTLKPTMLTSKKVKFLQEAAIMGQFFHSNVIRLFGVVTVGEPVMIVMELMGLGDLSKYLWENYRLNKKAAPQPVTLLSFCRQVACGMKYLAKKKYVHRDLAARNVFVNETLVCKVGDFGMSRHLEENYYMSSGGTVPIKWTAPEGLHYKKFSTASDVYSYGMLLYEIWSLGEKPLANIKIADVANLVSQGYCQPPPPGCPRKIYETMVKCWNPKYNDRPSFDEIFELLNRTDSDVLSWSEEDKALCAGCKMATQIGAPVAEGANLYQDLQKTYQITLV